MIKRDKFNGVNLNRRTSSTFYEKYDLNLNSNHENPIKIKSKSSKSRIDDYLNNLLKSSICNSNES